MNEKCFLNQCQNRGHERSRFSRFESKESNGRVILQAHTPCLAMLLRLSKLQGTKSAQCVSLFSLQGSALLFSFLAFYFQCTRHTQPTGCRKIKKRRPVPQTQGTFTLFSLLFLISFPFFVFHVVCLDHRERCMNGRTDVFTCLEFFDIEKEKVLSTGTNAF